MEKQCSKLACGVDSSFGQRFAEQIIEMKRSGIEMTTFEEIGNLYEVLKE
jgi:hypothetical protein